MTLKEKVNRAMQFAIAMKTIAYRLQSASNDYDVSFTREYVSDILTASDRLLKDIKGK